MPTYSDRTHQGGPGGPARVTKDALAARKAEDAKFGDPLHAHATKVVEAQLNTVRQANAAAQPGEAGEAARKALYAKQESPPMQTGRTPPGATLATSTNKGRR